jgi:predicted metal-dependent hydrolase
LLARACRIDPMRGSITYSVHRFDYRLRFSARKTMAITVHPDSTVEIIAPRGTPREEVEARLRKRARWVLRQFLHFQQFRPRSPKRRYVGGESHLYLGRQYRLKLVKNELEGVKLKGSHLLVASPHRRNARRVKRLVCAWYRQKGDARIVERFQAIAPRFIRLGCQPPALLFRSMPRRWGSFSHAGKILLNPDLIRAPVACIDYVITHELTHLIHPNHSVEFYDLLETMMPDWRARKQRLERLML